jgi:hypothetical protein
VAAAPVTTAPTAAASGPLAPATTTAQASTETPAAAELTPAMLDVCSQLSNPLSEDRKICPPVPQDKSLEKITAKMEGPVTRNLPVFQPTPASYCTNLLIDDFTDGSYKFTLEATYRGKTVYNTCRIEINKAQSQAAAAQQASEMENRCSQAGAAGSEECKEYYLDKYSEKIDCRNLDSTACGTTIKETYLPTIVAAEKKYESINANAPQLLDQTLTAGQLENIVNENGNGEKLDLTIALKEKETEVKVIKSYGAIILDKDNGLVQTAPIVLAIDSDKDGIPDDVERRLGTKPNASDSDGDGYKDGEEVLNGYDPLGEGKKDLSLSPIEKALVTSQPLEQPKASGEESSSLSINEVKTVYAQDGRQEGFIITGKAVAGSSLALYIYSDVPLVTTVTADEFGNWEYHFDKPLEDGNHEVYVTINDDTGKVVKKSSPLGFLVQEAQAAAEAAAPSPTAASDRMIDYYLWIAVALIVLGSLVFVVAILKSRGKNKNKVKQTDEQA